MAHLCWQMPGMVSHSLMSMQAVLTDDRDLESSRSRNPGLQTHRYDPNEFWHSESMPQMKRPFTWHSLTSVHTPPTSCQSIITIEDEESDRIQKT